MNIFLLILIILGIIAILGFTVAFFVEIANTNPAYEVEDKEAEKDEEKAPQNVNEEEVVLSDEKKETYEQVETKEEFDLDAMLARLEANSKEEAEEKEEKAEENKETVVVMPVMVEKEETEKEETSKKTTKSKKSKKAEEKAEEAEENKEEVKAEENKNNTTYVIVKETKEIVENENAKDNTSEEKVDLTSRLESVHESQSKVENDLTKVNREIASYERTDRRKARNQKLLDKKAEDLTKLNLVLYSVTDIKNIDEDKKQKQEELNNHIAELKSSIRDAEEYLEANRDKYENNLKMKEFYEGEKARLDADEKEILKLSGKDTDEE